MHPLGIPFLGRFEAQPNTLGTIAGAISTARLAPEVPLKPFSHPLSTADVHFTLRSQRVGR
jgi:hypothetical protein